ncbi:MAG TPA: hypothetical protein DER09_07635 [Prolixibacteraceae bacterium]|nr:hypothetical protein [Prolixibacteraceae bacterium]
MEKFEYETVLKNGPQLGVFADFPFDSQKIFGTRKAIPVIVQIDNKFSGELSLLPCGNGKHWLNLNRQIRLTIGKSEGDTVFITLQKNLTPTKPEIPEYLQWLLEDDLKMQKAFAKMPLSTRKFWIGYIEETKNEEVKVDKINRFFEYLLRHYSG